MNFADWEAVFESKILQVASSDDPAHDILHFRRVVALAKKMCLQEGADLHVVVPAAWLHDLIIVRKDSPMRSQASRLSAEKAIEFLKSVDYPEKFYEEIFHAIEAHSFSADIEARTPEAKIVQDADRLDGLGAIGVARCFATAGVLKRSFYNTEDAFCQLRSPDDTQYTLDHFYKKLFKIADTLQTKSGMAEGQKRVELMKYFLSAMKSEIL